MSSGSHENLMIFSNNVRRPFTLSFIKNLTVNTFLYNPNLPRISYKFLRCLGSSIQLTQHLRWTQLPLTGLRKLGYKPWGFSILFSSFLIFITCKDTRVQKNIIGILHFHGQTFNLYCIITALAL